MKSCIYWGHTEHSRSEPRRHSFRYPIFCIALDIALLESRGSPASMLRLNRFGIFSVHASDYLTPGTASIYCKFLELLRREGVEQVPAKTFLVTMPRVFGYVFNPVSFYISFEAAGEIHSILAEVNNTFGERHAYFLQKPNLRREDECSPFPIRATFPKEFYVSPFLESEGTYVLRLLSCTDEFNLQISFAQAEKRIFWVSLCGKARTLRNLELVRTVLAFPFNAALTMARIHVQGLILYFKHEAVLYQKPVPRSKGALRSKASRIHLIRLFLMRKLPRLRDLIPSVLPICSLSLSNSIG